MPSRGCVPENPSCCLGSSFPTLSAGASLSVWALGCTNGEERGREKRVPLRGQEGGGSAEGGERGRPLARVHGSGGRGGSWRPSPPPTPGGTASLRAGRWRGAEKRALLIPGLVLFSGWARGTLPHGSDAYAPGERGRVWARAPLSPAALALGRRHGSFPNPSVRGGKVRGSGGSLEHRQDEQAAKYSCAVESQNETEATGCSLRGLIPRPLLQAPPARGPGSRGKKQGAAACRFVRRGPGRGSSPGCRGRAAA